MEMMNELLEKYFRGETSLIEEKELKQYFSTANVAPEHEIYRSLFEVFELELKETAISPVIIDLSKKSKIRRIWVPAFALTGIAAILILLLWVQIPASTENYAVIRGNRIDNTEYVQQYTVKKLNKVNRILARSMEPMKSFNNVRKNIEPLQNLLDRRKINDEQNKLQFK